MNTNRKNAKMHVKEVEKKMKKMWNKKKDMQNSSISVVVWYVMQNLIVELGRGIIKDDMGYSWLILSGLGVGMIICYMAQLRGDESISRMSKFSGYMRRKVEECAVLLGYLGPLTYMLSCLGEVNIVELQAIRKMFSGVVAVIILLVWMYGGSNKE